MPLPNAVFGRQSLKKDVQHDNVLDLQAQQHLVQLMKMTMG
jgi:hypothetical protein